jgi:molybdopterin-containing oxidoreductase family iron-sulfur binding subunit
MNRSASTQRYWRSINDLEKTPEFQDLLLKEFPAGPEEAWTATSRRGFLQVMGASLALGSATACRFKEEHILPLKERDEDRIPGRPKFYASAMEMDGWAQPILVACYDGRPTKVDGNALHAESNGASTVWAQAGILGLYDPDRSRGLARIGGGTESDATWAEFEEFTKTHFRELKTRQGEGLAVIAGASRSPAFRRSAAAFRKLFPRATWTTWEPAGSGAEEAGCRAAFGKPVRPRYLLADARVIVALDDDFLYARPDATRLAREFAARRKPEGGAWMNRLYSVEPVFTVTGATADHRVPLRRAQVGAFLSLLEARLVEKGLSHPQAAEVANSAPRLDAPGLAVHVAAMADDLLAHRGAAVILAGAAQPAEVHARAQRLNALLGAAGKTVEYLAVEEPDASETPLAALAQSLNEGRVGTLVVLGGNPAYDAPADLGLGAALAKASVKIHLGLYRDETAKKCDWHLPQAHFLETWSDGLAPDGSHLIGQPMIEPIWGARSAIELLSLLTGNARTGMDLVREGIAGAEDAWRKAVHDGFIAGSAATAAAVEPRSLPSAVFDEASLAAAPPNGALELNFAPCPKVWDGRFANNGWLQELPDPIAKITWGNVALVSYATAHDLGIANEEMIRVECGGRSLEIVACTVPGAADGQLTMHLGYGRREAGHVAGLDDDAVEAIGFDSYALRGTAGLWSAIGARVSGTGASYKIASTQDHHMIDEIGLQGRADRLEELVRETGLEEFKKDENFAKRAADYWDKDESLFAEHSVASEYKWGMAIDLSTCTGCSACTIACQAENNIPVVGREQVLKGREMHWIRMDRYFQGDVANPLAVHQPVTCQQCELAPCESVCPVAATVHSSEGLNDMVYNRCVGTRYCSNNCPYKVRRFNFMNYRQDTWQAGNEVLKMAANPEVTVRSRGVMEKCTFCVQRIQGARVQSKLESRKIGGDEVKTACQQVCPTQSIVFGDLNDPNSAVAKAHANSRAYSMLAELNNKPRNRFLARIRNPHPLLALPMAGGEDHHG